MSRSRSRALLLGWGAFFVGLAALALECRRPASPPSVKEARGERAAPSPERARGPGLAPAGVETVRRVEASSDECVLTGIVLGRDGRPAAGVRVTADALTTGETLADDEAAAGDDEASETSGDDGAFEIVVPPGDWALTARDGDDVSEVLQPIVLGAGERLDGIELHLGGGATVDGRAVAERRGGDDDGGAISVCVLLHEHDEDCVASADADPDGGFSFEGLPVRPLWLRASSDEAEVVVPVVPPARGVELRLAPRPRVSGEVRDRGAPAADVEVYVTDAAGRLLREESSDGAGRFAITLDKPGPFVVWAEMDGGGVSPPVRTDGARGRELTLVLGEGAAVVGRVSSGLGAAIAGTELCLGFPDGKHHLDATVAADGSYRFERVPAGHWKISTLAIGDGGDEAAGTRAVEVDVPEAGTVRAPDITVDKQRRIRGRVVDLDGKPVADAEVDVVGDGGGFSLGSESTDADGNFTLSARVYGPITLRAWADGRVGDKKTVATTPGRDEEWVELRVSPECALSGVVRGPDGMPRAGVRVTCAGADRTSNGAGRFAMGCACHAPSLQVDDGRAVRSVPVRLDPDGDTYVDVRL